MRRLPRDLSVLAVVLLVLLLVGALAWWRAGPGWTVERVRDVVTTTLQEEVPASELVTGRVGVTARREIQDRGRFGWLPGWLGVPGVNFFGAGTRVEVVGQALYGVDVRRITPEMITLTEDGVVEVVLPPLHVVAVEADLSRLRVESHQGVMRPGAGRTLEEEALRDVQDALRAQAQRHIETSDQPALNTARALAATLRPAFIAAGMEDPRFRFRLGDELVLEPRPERWEPEAPLALPTP
jgi:hypothetical protein